MPSAKLAIGGDGRSSIDLGMSGAIRKRNEAPDALPGTGDVRMKAAMVSYAHEGGDTQTP